MLTLLNAFLLLFANWPQAAGPNGTWAVPDAKAPTEWSVAGNRNILWRAPLPNGGQSGIAVWGDRLFLTTFEPYKPGAPKTSATVLGHAIDAHTGKILWSVRLEGSVPSPMMYAYSDSTSPTPVTDGSYVWFTNASGIMGCYDFNGKEIWHREWKPWGEPYPFNKQHEPILYGDVILNVEPGEQHGWNYIYGIDKNTGKTKWKADDGTTTYATSVFGITQDGIPAVLTGRGGWHDVPERPVGLSLIDLRPATAGKTLWRFVAGDGNEAAPTWQALYVLHWDKKYAYWFRMNPEESHLVLGSRTGKLLREQSLIAHVDYRQWDPAANQYIVHKDVNLRDMKELSPRNQLKPGEVIRVMPAWHCNIVAGGYHYFLTTVAHRRNNKPPAGRAGPSHCIGRVNVETGKVEYLEVPVTIAGGKKIYGIAQRTKTEDINGNDVANEDRSRTDGWEIPAFWGSPIQLGNKLYFTTMLGITYVVDANAKVLDEKALLAINDLGPSGETWSLNTPSFSNGVLYHRSLKELVAIGRR
jgi:outer membrane protein assembly factor BamB